MTSYAGQLRQARAEILPVMSELLPELAQDHQVILGALKNAFAQSGKDPEGVPRADWNKAERYAISGHFIAQQSEILVEGSGSEARFKNFLEDPRTKRNPSGFSKNLLRTQVAGAQQVKASYEDNNETFGNPYSLAARRYRRLGGRAFIAHGLIRKAEGSGFWVKPGAAFEGIFLSKGMRTRALRGAAALHMGTMVSATKDLPKDERLQAAHDLSHIPIGLTGFHLADILDRKFDWPGLRAVRDEQNGRYRAVYDNPTDSREAYRSLFTDLPTVRHKCPAHVRLPDPETGIRMDSPLQNMFHAAINAGVELRYYEL